MVNPIICCPLEFNIAATVELSTPPLMATATEATFPVSAQCLL
jgi:hypothetical protein